MDEDAANARCGDAGRDGSLRHAIDAVVLEKLRRRAGHLMRRERDGHTLTPTDLVHETVRRLLEAPGEAVTAKTLPAVATVVMRRVLIDYARARRARPDRNRRVDVPIDRFPQADDTPLETVLAAVSDAVADLARINPRAADVLRLRYWDGLGVAEVAERLDVSASLVKLDTAWAKSFLRRRLGGRGTL